MRNYGKVRIQKPKPVRVVQIRGDSRLLDFKNTSILQNFFNRIKYGIIP